jgi:hypothetical protein
VAVGEEAAPGVGGEQLATAPVGGSGVPGFARLVTEPAGYGAEAWQGGDQGARRAAADEEPWAHRERSSPSGGRDELRFSAIAIEIALAGLRLARTLVTAPLRIGLAFLRPREI